FFRFLIITPKTLYGTIDIQLSLAGRGLLSNDNKHHQLGNKQINIFFSYEIFQYLERKAL
ncbi:MAG: hypothetical protein BV459_00005, partial [Thermoplasmata archaeon M11B2D]